MKTIPSFTGLITGAVLVTTGFPVPSAGQKPNIVFILTDDLGWNDLACYGNPHIETPVIDSLAENGILFRQSYAACPVCSPTRASILTGKYPARLHLTNFLVGNRFDPESPVLPPPDWKTTLCASEITVAELLHNNGYKTAMVGKWHVGGHDSIAPWNQGFDYTRLIGKNGLDYYNYSLFLDSYQNEYTDNGSGYLTDKLTEYGVNFIEKNCTNPFFLYLSYSAPHVFIIPRGDKLRKYFYKYGRSSEKFNPYYAAMVESIDDGVGRIMNTLRSKGITGNTIVVFTSDNGGLGLDELGPVPTTLEPLRKWKGHIYEGGIRVPAIVSWPGHIRSGSICDQYFTSTDWLPTLCEIAGITDLPDNIDGISIVPLLKDPEAQGFYDRPLFWHYPHFSNQLGKPAGAVRLGDFKLVELYETQKLELYNLRDDISESTDLADKMKEKTFGMHKMLSDWRLKVNAQMPVPNPAYSRKPRLLITTDIGGDPDDQQSLVRLMVYANEFEIEGLIASAAGTPGELDKEIIRPDLIEEIISGYKQVYPNLMRHDTLYPDPEYLFSVVKKGNPHRGWENVGAGHDTEGSEWIIRAADKKDNRPLNICIFGGQTDLAQALRRVKASRSAEKYQQFISGIRVYDISDQDRIFDKIFNEHPDLFYILAKAPQGADRREGAYRGIYLGGNESITSLDWLKENVLENHGPLGKIYPAKTWTAPNPHGAMKEGDTPSWFFFLENGLNIAGNPELGGWGGRFTRNEKGFYSDAIDSFQNVKNARATVFRWRTDFQSDFAARMDRCVYDFPECNHNPEIVVNGSKGKKILVIHASPGKTITLDATESTDPDGNLLRFEWFVYPETGYTSENLLLQTGEGKVLVNIPVAKKGESIYLVCKVTDNGKPNLTSCRRINLVYE